MEATDIKGVWTALVTPFTDSGEIDWAAYERLLGFQRESGVHGVIPCGTTGESPSLTKEEKKRLIETAVKTFKGTPTHVFAGTGSNSTAESVEFSKWASDIGVEGILVVAPYYNKPSQAGLKDHFIAIADAVDCQVMMYNIPGRTGIDMKPELLLELSSHPRINSLKDATGGLDSLNAVLMGLRTAKNQLNVLSGDDGLTFPMCALGASGVVSVASNLVPKEMVNLYHAINQGRLEEARDWHFQLYELTKWLFVEPNPVPIKRLMHDFGMCSAKVRGPLSQMDSTTESKLLSFWQDWKSART